MCSADRGLRRLERDAADNDGWLLGLDGEIDSQYFQFGGDALSIPTNGCGNHKYDCHSDFGYGVAQCADKIDEHHRLDGHNNVIERDSEVTENVTNARTFAQYLTI
jgi:hypothetical protein